jgi:hypothetical protein
VSVEGGEDLGRLGPASFALLREDERVVDEDVVLALLARRDLGGVPGPVDLGSETRGPFVVAASDRAVEDADVRHKRDSSW